MKKKKMILIIICICFLFQGIVKGEEQENYKILIEDNKEIKLNYTDENINETLLFLTDKKIYKGFTEDIIYFSLENNYTENDIVDIQFYFENTDYILKEINKLDMNVPYNTTIVDYGEKNYTCKDDWIEESVSVEWGNFTMYNCSDLEQRYCDNVEGNICTVNEDYLGTHQETRYTNIWVNQNFTVANILTNDQKNIILNKFIVSLDAILINITKYETQYFKAIITHSPNTEPSEFLIEAIGQNGAYGIIDPWFNTSWNNRINITINSSKVQGNITDFIIYIDLNDFNETTFFSGVNSDGGDIRFTESDGTTELAREVVFINTTAKIGEIHVEFNITNTSDTIIQIYYNNSGASEPSRSSTYGSDNVWKGEHGNYLGVWHLQENQSGVGNPEVYTESSENNKTGDDNISETIKPIKIGLSQGYDNDNNDFIEVQDGLYNFNCNDSYSLSYWGQTINDGSYEMIISRIETGSDYTGWEVYKRSDQRIEWQLISSWTSDVVAVYSTNAFFVDDNWYHNIWSYNGGLEPENVTLYNAGANISLTIRYNTMEGDESTGCNIDRPIEIGGRDVSGSQWNNLYGYLDEMRIHDDVITADWAKTEYNNQNDPDSFYTVGTVETIPVEDTCSCPASGNWSVLCSDNCTISSDCDIGSNNLIISGSVGSFTINANITAGFFATESCKIRGLGIANDGYRLAVEG